MVHSVLSRASSRRYLPLYLSLILTGLLLSVLFLRPGTVAGLTVEAATAKTPAKADVPAGFKLDPTEAVVLDVFLRLQALEFADITSVKLTITDPAAAVLVNDLPLPLPADGVDTEVNLTSDLQAADGKGSLSVKVLFEEVAAGGIGYTFGFGYQGLPADAGIRYVITYLPEAGAIAGDYNADISVFLGTRTASTVKQFVGTGPNGETADFDAVTVTIPGLSFIKTLLPLNLFKGTFDGDSGFLAVDAGAGTANQNILPIVDRNGDGVVDKLDIEIAGAGLRVDELTDSVNGVMFLEAVDALLPGAVFNISYRTRTVTGGEVTSETLFNTSTVTFRLLPPFTVTPGTTLYPRGGTGGVTGDLVVLQADVNTDTTDTVDDIDTDDELGNGILSVTVDADFLFPDTQPTSMIEKDLFHPALLSKWGVASTSDFILPLKLRNDAVPGTFDLPLKAVDVAGNEAVANGVEVTVLDKRDEFNVYLMPGVNFITPGIECSPSTDARCVDATGMTPGVEFDITTLLTQDVTSQTIGATTLEDVVQNIFWYCPEGGDLETPTLCTAAQDGTFLVRPSPPGAADFTSLRAGRGYLVVTDSTKFLTEDHPDQGLTDTPVPIKMTFMGQVLDDPSDVPDTTRVLEKWNLVGPHSERDTAVGNFLAGAQVLDETLWVILHTFNNSLNIALTSEGVPQLSGGKPLAELNQGSFDSRTPFGAGPSEIVPAGSGSWLFMCEQSSAPLFDRCEDGASLPPVLE